jgi:ornithine cyclodeaminase/alanine dehydrogenase-like protein (mu-crystallin family)
LARLLEYEEVIEAVAEAFKAYSSGRTQTPLRVGVEPPGTDGVLLAMPSAVAEPAALGAKVVSVFRGNPARGLPTVTSIYILSEYETGAPLALMDGGYLTGIRTAAGSAVATRALARPDASTLAVFGTGVQARFHVETIRRVRRISEVWVCGTTPAKVDEFLGWVTKSTGLVARGATAEQASAADVVAACTTSPTPVVIDDRVQQGAHVNAVGAFTPTTRELPAELVQRARVYVDTRAGALSEAGDLLLAGRDDVLEIGELLLGRGPGRQDPQDVTVYKSVGAAFLDASTARLAYQAAGRVGVGTVYEFDAQ